MRYIRTKYGRIFEVLEEDKQFYYIGYPNEVGLALWGKLAKDVIKEADTIEELCDAFVIVHKDGTHVFQKSTADDKVSKEYVEYLLRNNQTFYGAIWTDKGLIYVAKMNEKGELELL